MKLSAEEMYRASAEKNPDYEGVFWMAVKTTGIFCRPTCTARKPKAENVEFFNSTKEAILHGYRPCKVCRPLENLHETPVEIQQILNDITAHPEIKITDADLLSRGLHPHTVRRWFLKNHGLTFHAFQRMFRLNSAFKKLQQGENISDTAVDTGYESISGFSDGFKNVFGVSPKNSRSEKIIDLKRIETPLGTMLVCADEKGICLLEFSDRKALPSELKQITKHFDATIIQGENPHFKTLETELKEYFNGSRTTFEVPLSPVGTEFQKQVWEVLQRIPYATTRSYLEQATILGKPSAVRAVANANGLNKISIIIPCHRVIGANGQLTGYGGGIWRKKMLLDLEKRHSTDSKTHENELFPSI